MVIDSRSQGQSSDRGRSRQPSQGDQRVSARKHSSSGHRSQTDSGLSMELRHLTSFIERIEDGVLRLQSAGSRGSSPAPKRRAPESLTNTPQSLVDHEMEWSDNEDERDGPPLPATLLEDNLALVATSFSVTLSNVTQRKVKGTLPLPELKETHYPPLDSIFKSSLWQRRSKWLMQNLPTYKHLCWTLWVP